GGIRDFRVTGVQTCALPIFERELDGRDLALAVDQLEEDEVARVLRVPDALAELQPLHVDVLRVVEEQLVDRDGRSPGVAEAGREIGRASRREGAEARAGSSA